MSNSSQNDYQGSNGVIHFLKLESFRKHQNKIIQL